MAKNLLLDTGFWFALYEKRDSHHNDALALADLLEIHNLIIPWPCLYETLNTRFVRRREWIHNFVIYADRTDTVRLPDEAYRHYALQRVLKNTTPWLSLSLVDEVIRMVLLDPGIKIDAVVTFNPGDFYDICHSRRIELIPG